MAGTKGKTNKAGSGSANDKRGGIAKAKESAARSSSDRAGGGRQEERAEQDKGNTRKGSDDR